MSETKKNNLEGLPKAVFPGTEGVSESRRLDNNLKYLRQKAGLTLEALSLVTKGVDPEGVGISRVSLSRYEAGAEPGLRELKLLSWAFRKPLAYIVYGDYYDPMGEAAREPLDILMENIVVEILERRGLVNRQPQPYEESYEKLLDAAKRLAKK